MEHFSTIWNLRDRSVLFLKFKLNKSFDIFFALLHRNNCFLNEFEKFSTPLCAFLTRFKRSRALTFKSRHENSASFHGKSRLCEKLLQQTKERDRDRVNIIIIRHYSSFILPFSQNFSRNITQNKRWNFF